MTSDEIRAEIGSRRGVLYHFVGDTLERRVIPARPGRVLLEGWFAGYWRGTAAHALTLAGERRRCVPKYARGSSDHAWAMRVLREQIECAAWRRVQVVRCAGGPLLP